MQIVSIFVFIFGNKFNLAHYVHENRAPYVFEFYIIPFVQSNEVFIG